MTAELFLYKKEILLVQKTMSAVLYQRCGAPLLFSHFLYHPPIRDIPMPLVSSGVEHGNLRELALARMKDMGTEVRL